MLIHKHLIITGHFDTINPLMWPWPKLHDLNDDLLKVLEEHNFYSKKEQLIDRPFVKKDS